MITNFWNEKTRVTSNNLKEIYKGKKGKWTVIAQGSLNQSHNFNKKVDTVSKAISLANRTYDKYPGSDDFHGYEDDIVIISPDGKTFGHLLNAEWVYLR